MPALPIDLLATGPPASLEELVERARRLGGVTLGDLADALEVDWPPSLGRHKGFIGNLLETALGSTGSVRPVPDFPELGVELKTIPVDHTGRPRESTWVCTAGGLAEQTWSTSRVRHKLAHVLFVPIESADDMDDRARRAGAPQSFEPTEDEEAILRADWEDLSELIVQGLYDALSARRGHALQIRPKAARADVRRTRSAPDGERFETLPRGFYLRRSFTDEALSRRRQALAR
jgi:DNA mismatch repair protein MutH